MKFDFGSFYSTFEFFLVNIPIFFWNLLFFGLPIVPVVTYCKYRKKKQNTNNHKVLNFVIILFAEIISFLPWLYYHDGQDDSILYIFFRFATFLPNFIFVAPFVIIPFIIIELFIRKKKNKSWKMRTSIFCIAEAVHFALFVFGFYSKIFEFIAS